MLYATCIIETDKHTMLTNMSETRHHTWYTYSSSASSLSSLSSSSSSVSCSLICCSSHQKTNTYTVHRVFWQSATNGNTHYYVFLYTKMLHFTL